MKPYWDSSALVESFVDSSLRSRLSNQGGITRTQSLAEVFSALTSGNLAIRVDASAASRMVADIARHLVIDLTSTDVLGALEQTRRRGVRGGRIHDFLHAVAAEKAKAERILTAIKTTSSHCWIRCRSSRYETRTLNLWKSSSH